MNTAPTMIVVRSGPSPAARRTPYTTAETPIRANHFKHDRKDIASLLLKSYAPRNVYEYGVLSTRDKKQPCMKFLAEINSTRDPDSATILQSKNRRPTPSFEPSPREQRQAKDLHSEIFWPMAGSLGLSTVTRSVPVSHFLTTQIRRSKIWENGFESSPQDTQASCFSQQNSLRSFCCETRTRT